MMKHLSLLMAFSLIGLFSCKGYKDLSADAFEKMLSEDGSAQLVDVRTPEEFAEGHIPGALNIDWKADDFIGNATAALSKDRPVMVYCRSGKRSAAAAGKLSGAGFKVLNLTGGFLGWKEAGKRTTVYEADRFCTPSGKAVTVTLIKHGSLEISFGGRSIQIDPVSGLWRPTDYAAEFPKADFILVTHEHGDHFDKEAISALTDEGTSLVTNARCAEMLGQGKALANGESYSEGILTVDAVPAYNTTRDHLQFHPKGRDNGYVLTLDGYRIYIAGDTEDIPEMAGLKDIDLAFLPCNQPYTMTVEQLVHAAKVIQPKVLIPYHYSRTDISSVPELLPGMDVRIRQMQ